MGEKHYQGIRAFDPEGRIGLRNPERGFRTEGKIADQLGSKLGLPASLTGLIGPGYSDDAWIYDARKFEPFGLTLVQGYCYLDQFTDRPISKQKLAALESNLNLLRHNGLKVVLRFAYEGVDGQHDVGPTPDRILSHLDQLEPVIRRNVDVIHVLQAGLVGIWGEWHCSAHNIQEDPLALSRIMKRLLQALPRSRMTQVRKPDYKRWVLSEAPLRPFSKLDSATAFNGSPVARIGLHNDGFLSGKNNDGFTWPEPPYYANPGNPEFDYFTDESPYLANDGELYWHMKIGKIDGWKAAVRLRLHHYTSLSLAHSYSLRVGDPYCLDAWMTQNVTLAQVRRDKMPASDGYFKDPQGKTVPRSAFDYIRDHLGYRLELQEASFPTVVRPGGTLSMEARLINRGFSTPVNPRRISFVLIHQDTGKIHEFTTDIDIRKWQPFEPGDRSYKPLTHTIRLPRVKLPATLRPGPYQIGLWLAAPEPSIRLDPHYAVRLANRDILWWTNRNGQYGINVLGTLTCQAR
jgi:Domain of unknown function (DUF4832)/Domain of unknown function (DUF4874)